MPLAERQVYPLDHATHLPILIGLGLKISIIRVLELGAGSYSTPLFVNRDVFPDLVELVSVEHDPEWRERIRGGEGNGRIVLTDTPPTDRSRFHLIFVDSADAASRTAILRLLRESESQPALIVVHDSENEWYHEEIEKFPKRHHFVAFNPETSVIWRADDREPEIYKAIMEIDAITRLHANDRPDDIAKWIELFRAGVSPAPPSHPLTVSVDMVTYRRVPQMRNTLETYLIQTRKPDELIVVEDGYDGGETESLCKEFSDRLPIKYVCRRNRPDVPFSNAAIPRNIGIRQATGDIIVLHNSEVRFTKPTDFANIVGPTEADPMICTCAPCEALNPDGSHKQWYCDPHLWNFSHFCAAYRRKAIVEELGGFDEAYRRYGWEDMSFNMRANRAGIVSIWAKDVVTQHQWHEVRSSPQDREAQEFNIRYSTQEMEDILSGRRTLEANLGKPWGDLSS